MVTAARQEVLALLKIVLNCSAPKYSAAVQQRAWDNSRFCGFGPFDPASRIGRHGPSWSADVGPFPRRADGSLETIKI